MSYDDAMEALSNDALKLIKNNQVIGLGSGRAATLLVKSLGKLIKNVAAQPQIKLIHKNMLSKVEEVHYFEKIFCLVLQKKWL